MPTPPPRRRLSPAERSAQIGRAAIDLARAEGLSAVTLRGIAASVGVAPSLVAHYHPSMEDLVGATFRSIAAAEVAEVRRIVGSASTADPLAPLRTLLDCISDPARDDVAALWADAWSIGRTNDALAAAAREVMDDWQGLATSVVTDGVAAGVLRTEDPDAVARLLFALVDATNGYALVQYLDRRTREDLVRAGVARAVGLDERDLTA
ncbi:TetR/AcrR family transcriptional regulator [Curtobacterium sp. ISL-83]|uniref:TetR/AcrR family transcriptional regulator n=1 Tax=Curtobacterium sp. ISL-83 TaxID=2819145 RepID=UPI001BE710F8|nr:TetR/AcrR family transcriptional regulator [Curtobacterium sp. ISL-83]MBT2502199.1 TetR/AcrR family transcriptional regulator [Curtobacterium sp. ISL-83]